LDKGKTGEKKLALQSSLGLAQRFVKRCYHLYGLWPSDPSENVEKIAELLRCLLFTQEIPIVCKKHLSELNKLVDGHLVVVKSKSGPG
jgi:hypothetical protein